MMGFTVPSGRETGVYYLILAGVSFSATWKDLKDHARSHQLEVDYVEIYADKHGGWIRLLGHENFIKASKIFNGAHIRDHAIQVHTQNESNPVVLRYPPPSSYQPLQQQSIFTQPQQLHSHLPSPPSSISYSGAQFRPPTPVMDGYYTHVPYGSPDAFPRPIDQGQVAFQSQIPLVNPVPYSYNTADGSPFYSTAPEQFTVRTEFRKVVIKNLPDYMTTKAVHDLMEWALVDMPSYEATWIEEITLPTPKSGKSRRHACVLLRNFAMAERVKSLLDEYPYEGKKLSVEFAKEGATPSSTKPLGTKDKGSKKSDKKSEKKPQSSCSKDVDKVKGESSSERHHRPRTPAVVDGSGTRPKHKH